jgi:multiple sugar transport system substrate-binding protein
MAADGGAAPRATVGPTTITFTHWWAPPATFGVAMGTVLERWAARGTPIKVDSQVFTSAEILPKYINMLAGGTAPDVAFIQPFNFAPLHAKGAWVDISASLKHDEKEINLGDFYPEPMVRVTKEGKLYGFPTDINVSILLYNKTLLDAGGVKVPGDDYTWDALLDDAKRLTKGEDADKVWGTTFPSDWEPNVWANGGEVLDKNETLCLLDQAAAYDAIQWLADLRFRQRVAPLPADLAMQDVVSMFVAGKLALLPVQSGATSNIKGRNPSFPWGVANYPKGKVARQGYLRGGNVAMMNPRAKEASWQFLKYMSSPEVHALWANPGTLMPPRKSVAESGAFIQPPPPLDLKRTLDAVPPARNPHLIPEYTDMTDIIAKTLGPVWNTGERTARDAAIEAKRQIDTLLAPRRK